MDEVYGVGDHPSLPQGWVFKKISDVGNVITGKTPSTKRAEYWNGEIPFITPPDLQGTAIRQVPRSITREGLGVSKPLPHGTVLVSCIGYIGKVGILDTECAVTNQQINAVIPDSTVDTWFLAYLFQHFKPHFENAAAMTTVPILNKRNFEAISIPLPPLLEQKKIAAVLSAVQEVKETTEEVIKATRELKKSLMKHLFTYGPVPVEEAENVRLKETEIGLIPEEWEVARLGDIGQIRYGLSQPPEQCDDGVPMVRATNIKQGNIVREGLLHIKAESIPPSRNPFLETGDIIVVRSGAYTGDLAMIIPEWAGSIAGYDLIISRSDHFDSKYLAQYLLGKVVQNYFRSQRDRSAQPHLNSQQLAATLVALPPLPTQQKMADILSAVDEKTEAEENKKKALEELFKTLLNDLMSAKIRVHDLEIEA